MGVIDAVIHVTPGEPLGDRWYVLEATNVPSTVNGSPVLPNEGVATRFRPT